MPHEVRSKSNIREVKMEPERVNKISRVRFATISSKLTQVFPSVSQSVSLCVCLSVSGCQYYVVSRFSRSLCLLVQGLHVQVRPRNRSSRRYRSVCSANDSRLDRPTRFLAFLTIAWLQRLTRSTPVDSNKSISRVNSTCVTQGLYNTDAIL